MEEMVSMLCDEILKAYQAGFKEGIKIGYEAGANSSQDDQSKIVFLNLLSNNHSFHGLLR